MLFREFKLTKDQFMRMSDWDIRNWLLRPGVWDGDPEKGYWPVPRYDPKEPPLRPLSYREWWWEYTGKALKEEGATDEEIESRWQEWSKSLRPEHGGTSRD